ncbi:helix-turn-helix transcriptional regulator [Kitasatospora sp. NPDC028055]|uniref:helix-turn-helix transcriptional regulator n=1 Tax=Kitasatospora sp. NPDC028055 TaxID=3155653 RepID=UPI0033E63B97
MTDRTARVREQLVLLCEQDTNVRTLRLALLPLLRRVIGFDAYVWLATDPETSVGSAPLADVPCLPELPRLIRLKYCTTVNRWTGLSAPVASLHQATGGDLERSLMWRDLLRHYQVTDIASSVFRDRFGCWGFLDLWRLQDAPAFTTAELDFLHSVTAPLTAALRRSQAATFTTEHAGAPPPAGPAIMLLSPELQVRATTPPTQHYLRQLIPPDSPGRAPIPAGAYNVGAQLLAREAAVDANPARARVHLGSGHWLTLRAARMDSGAPVPERDIAVTIETTAPSERLTLFARSYGLSTRETELLAHLRTGANTREVARLMFLSENTVQDHLKSVFAKTGSRTRQTLLAHALGTQ